MMMRDLTIAEIDEALSFVSPDVARGDWVQIGMALKAELADAGFDLFDRWSQGSDKYKAKDCKSTWRSIKASGGVGLGTLIKAAQDAGWKLRPDERDEADRQRYAAEMAERRRVAQEQLAAEAAWRGRMADAVAAGCQKLCQWLADNQNSEQQSPYLQRKQVANHGGYVVAAPVLLVVDDLDESSWIVSGEHIKSFFVEFNGMDEVRKDRRSVRKLSAGDLVLPLTNAGGVIRSVQIIYKSGTKSFPRHGDKSGCAIEMRGDDSVLLLAEGYATAASVHWATGRTAIACLDAGNLVTVASIIAERMPGKRLLICADDDETTDGENPGAEFAARAAAGKQALVVSPDWSVIERQEAA
jgi:putative DNA primase/helicase